MSGEPKLPGRWLAGEMALDGCGLDRSSIAYAAMESAVDKGRLTAVPRLFDRIVCRYSSHDWWALAYPPARRWECHRCGAIVEEVPSTLPDRRRVPRDKTKKANGPSRS
jgi:hypothetical protein